MSWADALAGVDASVSSAFDETLVTAIAFRKPSNAVNANASADPDRPAFEFFGTLDMEPEINSLSDASRFNPAERGLRNVLKTCVTALLAGRAFRGGAELPEGWPWEPKQGDRLTIGTTNYTIATIDRDGTQRVAYWLNRVT